MPVIRKVKTPTQRTSTTVHAIRAALAAGNPKAAAEPLPAPEATTVDAIREDAPAPTKTRASTKRAK